MDKIRTGIKKIKGKLIFCLILLIVMIIIFVAPFSIAIKEALETGAFNFTQLWTSYSEQLSNPFGTIGKIFSAEYIGSFWSVLWKFTLFYILIMAVGLYKAMPKHEYDDIEHGSSDWSENGEQYSVLSKNKGILLAQKNYLPINKRGNINVLVVGRIWIW